MIFAAPAKWDKGGIGRAPDALDVRHAVRRTPVDSQAAVIAIIDDDEGVRTSLSSLLRSFGYEIRSYGSATEFLDERGRADPDCLIADMQMPRMSGEQLQAELLARGRTFPMIFMTAFPAETVRIRVMARGACAFLDKPVDGDRIAGCLASALAGNGAS